MSNESHLSRTLNDTFRGCWPVNIDLCLKWMVKVSTETPVEETLPNNSSILDPQWKYFQNVKCETLLKLGLIMRFKKTCFPFLQSPWVGCDVVSRRIFSLLCFLFSLFFLFSKVLELWCPFCSVPHFHVPGWFVGLTEGRSGIPPG